MKVGNQDKSKEEKMMRETKLMRQEMKFKRNMEGSAKTQGKKKKKLKSRPNTELLILQNILFYKEEALHNAS